MSATRTVLCGSIPSTGANGDKNTVLLDVVGPTANVHLRISNISKAMVHNVPDVLTDLLELAAYVFAADQAVRRGSPHDTGRQWRRRFSFHVPVRLPDLWSRNDVTTALVDALSFLSDDDYQFSFHRLQRSQPVQLYLELIDTALAADQVVLFSGGIDSLGGAVKAAVGDGRRVALVSHRSAPKRVQVTDRLAGQMSARAPEHPYYIPVWTTKAEKIGREFTQRTRSFLYASLAAAVARMLRLDRIFFYENGVTSLNLPIAPQLVGARASRTTHPQALSAVAKMLSLLFDRTFAVENPFLWYTKAEVVQVIKDHGCVDLVKQTVSCSRVIEATKLETHCGRCSQCIDRRFATLAAGLSDDEDPAEMYKVQLLTDARVVGETRTMAEAFVRRAQDLPTMEELEFLKAYPEATRALGHVDLPSDEAARRIHDLHRRHGGQVVAALAQGYRTHAAEFQAGSLPDSCLLVLAALSRYCQRDGDGRNPTFQWKGDHWGIWFENEETTLKDGVGPRYIALLLASPGKKRHVIDLQIEEAILSGKFDAGDPAWDDEGGVRVRRSPSSSGGTVTDRLAVRRYRARLNEIEEELVSTRSAGDPSRHLELQEEKQEILRHMRSAIDLRGRPRPSADDDERARQAVTKAISRTTNRLWNRHPSLARHLKKSLMTGEFCLYNPDPPVSWLTN
ncbi:MAG: 7-cyano-7-deazaguanine synthase [Candidatus Eisenbacteria bacterium]|nr:7-cyano-7-deazaguanine synthase [Candidatus Eisenbacteria bacterium]